MPVSCHLASLYPSIPLRVPAAQADAPDCTAPTNQAGVLHGLTTDLAALNRQRLSTAACEFETAERARRYTVALGKLADFPGGDIICPGRKP